MTVLTASRERLERLARATAELRLREERKLQQERGGLLHFVRHFWDILEPKTPLVEDWPLYALCEHLEAISRGELNQDFLANVCPGFMKSLLVNVFWPAWEWGPFDQPHLRYVSFSYAAHLTERDNRRLLNLLQSHKWRIMWGHCFNLLKAGETLISNDKTGWKLATSVGGVGTGERGDRILLDDPHNVAEGESEAVRTRTVTWFRESMTNRLNNMETGRVVVIMQRVHEEDVSGTISKGGFDYCHLMIPMEFDSSRACKTSIGWEDPRTEDGELAWPGRFSPKVVNSLKSKLGPYAYTAQYQQSPEPRGGGIIKRDFWQLWDPPDGKFPKLDYILASADTAYTEKEENDPTGFVILGLFKHSDGFPKVVLLTAWRKRLEIHGRNTERQSGETEAQWIKRTQKDWGLCEWLAYSCRRFKVDRLIIEGKASGLSVAQEMRRLHSQEGWGIMTVTPDGDKVARAYAVQSLFSDGLIYAPDREWAQMVIDEMAVFPKGSYKDLTDAMTQGLKHLREVGLAVRREERVFEEEDRRKHKSQLQPLYDV